MSVVGRQKQNVQRCAVPKQDMLEDEVSKHAVQQDAEAEEIVVWRYQALKASWRETWKEGRWSKHNASGKA